MACSKPQGRYRSRVTEFTEVGLLSFYLQRTGALTRTRLVSHLRQCIVRLRFNYYPLDLIVHRQSGYVLLGNHLL